MNNFPSHSSYRSPLEVPKELLDQVQCLASLILLTDQFESVRLFLNWLPVRQSFWVEIHRSPMHPCWLAWVVRPFLDLIWRHGRLSWSIGSSQGVEPLLISQRNWSDSVLNQLWVWLSFRLQSSCWSPLIVLSLRFHLKKLANSRHWQAASTLSLNACPLLLASE